MSKTPIEILENARAGLLFVNEAINELDKRYVMPNDIIDTINNLSIDKEYSSHYKNGFELAKSKIIKEISKVTPQPKQVLDKDKLEEFLFDECGLGLGASANISNYICDKFFKPKVKVKPAQKLIHAYCGCIIKPIGCMIGGLRCAKYYPALIKCRAIKKSLEKDQ